MENFVEFEVIDPITQDVKKHVAIEKEDGGSVTMPKEIWDELQAKQTEGGLI